MERVETSTGWVELVSSMGDESSVCRIARVCTGRDEKEASSVNDAALVRSLLAREHGTPFEFIQLIFKICCPNPIAVQWMRHRTGSFQQKSGRYTDPIEDKCTPNWRCNDTVREDAAQIWADSYARAMRSYRKLRALGVPREQARFVMPQGMITRFFWRVDMRNFLGFLKLRADKHAQEEMQEFANACKSLARERFPNIIGP